MMIFCNKRDRYIRIVLLKKCFLEGYVGLTFIFPAGNDKWRWRHNLLHRRHDCHHGIAAVEMNRVVPQVTPQSKKPSSLSTSKVVVRGHEADDLQAGRAVPVRQCRHALRHGVQRRKASAAAGVHAAGGEHPRPGVVRLYAACRAVSCSSSLTISVMAATLSALPASQPGSPGAVLVVSVVLMVLTTPSTIWE